MSDPQIAQVPITHPDKILYPQTNTTKLELEQYYQKVATDMLKFLKDRPVSLVRAPHGAGDFKFYQKHPQEGFPEYIERVRIHEKAGGSGVYITLDGLNDIIYLVNLGVLEFHVWLASLPDLEHPDRIVFDLDPDPKAEWSSVILAAQEIKQLLEADKLESWVQVSGNKGLHIMVPLTGEDTWLQTKTYSKALADKLVIKYPEQFTTNLPKIKRRGKVFIDYLRNSRGATNICTFSTRATQHPTVATPVKWSEVTNSLKPNQFDIHTVLKRPAVSTVWPGFFDCHQKLP